MFLRKTQSSLRQSLSVFPQPATLSRYSYATVAKSPIPLRILFCGSDEFSCASLQAVYNEHINSPERIASIDVMCRPGKPSGRGLKSIREVPIKGLAQHLGLRLHERDTFTGWNIPRRDNKAINLLIAVSFGLFVPPRILESVEYGGLNVHPSLLPDLRGPAPLYHSLLRGDQETGITLQTLHPKKFDHGKILLQRKFTIPKPDTITYPELLSQAKVYGPEVLIEGLRKRVYLPEYNHSNPILPPNGEIIHAPKITPLDRQVNLKSSSVKDILRRDRVLGRLWCNVQTAEGQLKRLVLSGLESYAPLSSPESTPVYILNIYPTESTTHQVRFQLAAEPGSSGSVIFWIGDQALLVRDVTIEGSKKSDAKTALLSDGDGVMSKSYRLRFTGEVAKE